MAEASDIFGTVFKNGSATLLARVVGAGGIPVTQADVASAKYTLYLVDESDPDTVTPVTGHAEVALDVASLVYDSLQNDDLWNEDDTGYNFKHVLDVSTHQAFSTAGRHYRAVFTLTPTSGQVILVRFRLHAI